ncbi:MAG: carbonate dehydratase [Bacteriovoracaceae bacterium]|nr:carbonate dehydratase [Bacteriovoracaceae bacterium]
MKDIKRLLLENKLWAEEKSKINNDYFKEMAKDQKPNFLWIGCSDSRVPPDEITGASPGEMFVARNVANLIIHTDLNLMSVVDYAIHSLKVNHVIICGHYGCGGVRAALGNQNFGMINKWIRNIKDIHQLHWEELSPLGPEERFDRLVELNVIEQAKNLTHTSIVQKAWKSGHDVKIHGWIYAMSNGLLNQLITIDQNYPIEDIYRFDL